MSECRGALWLGDGATDPIAQPGWALARAGGEMCGKTVGLRDKQGEYIFLVF